MRIFCENIPVYFIIQRLLARQWTHSWRQSSWLRYFTHFLREGDLVSCGLLRGCLCLSTETGLRSANCAEGWRFHSALCVQRAENCCVPELQFSDELVTCLL